MVHEMTLIETHEGTETWTCPICGRTLLIEWNPFRKITSITGDENVSHSGMSINLA